MPLATLFIFSWISLTVWNLFPYKSDFSFGKSQKSQGAKSGLYVGWVTWMIDILPKLCMRRDAWVGVLWWSCQSPVPTAVAFWIIWTVSAEECSSLMQNFMQIHCFTCSVILNVMATQCTCSLKGIYCPHWLVQWSRHCSRMSILVLFPWLPGYSNVMQTIFIILTRVGVFPDRPYIHIRGGQK